MSELLRNRLNNSQQVQSLLLNKIATVSNKLLADCVGCDPAKISKFSSGMDGGAMNLDQLANMLPALDLALVECQGGTTITIPYDEYCALVTFSRRYLSGAPIPGAPIST